MRRAPNERVERFRLPGPMGGPPNTNCGASEFLHRGNRLRVIASDGMGWDHVSVSLSSRCPTWDEMAHVKKLFFHEDEVAMQLHVAEGDHVNNHRYCLHLWRPQTAEEIAAIRAAYGEEWPFGDVAAPGPVPLPPPVMVGLRDLGTLSAA